MKVVSVLLATTIFTFLCNLLQLARIKLSSLDNKKLMQLAVENFEFQQSIYMRELEELKGWSKKYKLSEMGFGREKTLYTYFAIAASCCLPYNSIMRLVIAKTAIIITVADDFYDMEGSLSELEILTDAVKRWDGTGLCGHSKTIFDSLDDFVNDIAANFPPQERSNILSKLRDIKEQADGKINFVLLHMKQNPNITIQDSVDYVQQLLEAKTKEFVKHVFMDGFDESDMSKSCKQIHFSCMKVFQMFFNSANLFDSETALLDDIKKAIYLPIDHKEKSKPLVKPVHSIPMEEKKKKESPKITTPLPQMHLKHSGSTSFIGQRFNVKNFSVAGRGKVHFPMKFNMCLV